MSLETRRVGPEWLDTLPPTDPRAQRSRRDLDRVNAVMGNARIVAARLRERFPRHPPRSIADIGAGDGSFMLRLARMLPPSWAGTRTVLVDRLDVPSPGAVVAVRGLGWKPQRVAADVLHWLADPHGERHDAMVTNLVLHHFDSDTLEQVLALVARRTDVFIACEPRRSELARAGSRMLGLIGCNDVSRHDALVSVDAGFIGAELAELWPRQGGWTLEETERGLFSHCFVAWRPLAPRAVIRTQ